MQDSARVVIIGGGIIGCSVAYHLTRMGWKDTVVIEKGELTSGSTWHAAGLVGQFRNDRNLTRMLQYSVSLYQELEKETGLTTGWKQTGCLHLAKTEARMYELKGGATTARSFGLEMNMISPKEAHDLCPIISYDDVIGAAYMPTDGQADPAGITQAMARGARNRGAKFYERTLVTGFDIKNKRVNTVKTDKGDIKCEIVVNCCGMWGYQVGKMLGVNVPLVPFQHQYVVTEQIQGMPIDIPTIRDKDNLIYYKEEMGGLVMGGYERNGIPWSTNGVPNDFISQLLEPDFEHFESISNPAQQRTPCLEQAGIARLVNGPEAFTTDGDAIMGPAPELDNCFVAAGFNAFGIAAGGGAGRMMAEWIIEGAPSLNIWPLDIRRFGSYHGSRKYCVDRTREAYGKHYTIHWPSEENDSARGIRRSPLYQILKDKGAVFGAKYGWERANWFAPEGVEPKDEKTFEKPNWFEHVAAEHKAARENVVLIDQTPFSKIEVEGPGALKFLNTMAANDIEKPVGSVTYTQFCNEKGNIESDVTIARIEEQKFLIVTGTAYGLHDLEWIKKHLPKDGSVYLRDASSSYAVINVIGPNSRKLIEKVSPDDIKNDVFKFSTCKHITVGYAPVFALRVTYVGELGYELYIPTEYACHVYETLWDAGQDFSVKNAGYRAIDSLHFEKGYCYWGSELSPEYNPYEAGLGFCVKLNKGQFVGKRALSKIKADGSKSSLFTFTLLTDETVRMRGSEPILHHGEVLGVTTSAGYGHTVRKNICYGYLKKDQAGYGDEYEIEVYKKTYRARLEKNRALYDPKREKILM
jgi:sarcosine dehydrogenase